MERELTLRILSPVVLHAERNRVQFAPGLDHIPGSTLRGAAAAHYLQVQKEDDDFRALFVEEAASFSDFLPATYVKTYGWQRAWLLPATARLCKRYGWDHRDSLTDALLRLELERLGDLAPLDDPLWKYCPDPHCQSAENKRDRVQGYLGPGYAHVKTEKRLLSGASINRSTGTAESGQLFSQEALAEGQTVKGVVRINGADAKRFQALLETVLQVGARFRVGSARSRGLGLIEVQEWSDPSVGPGLESRFREFNQAVRALWQRYQVQLEPGTYFSLTLESHLILRDAAGQPVTRLEGRSDLAHLQGLDNVTLCRHVILSAVVRGWNARQGLPKEDAPAIGRGSVLLFRIEPGQEIAAQERLATIERDGLGWRRSEGFGRMSVCNPFHYDFVLKEMQEALQ